MKTWAQAVLESNLKPLDKFVGLIIWHHTSGNGVFPKLPLTTVAKQSGLTNTETHDSWKNLMSAGFMENTAGEFKFTLPTTTPELSLTPFLPKAPKVDYEAEFVLLWKHTWNRGPSQNPKQPAFKAFMAARKRGATLEELVNAAKNRVGVGNEGTEFALMMSTWLNQQRYKDAKIEAPKQIDVWAPGYQA